MKKKSRNLSVLEYYEVLQKEYIVAELRRKIYPNRKDKDYYENVMDGKRKKIEDIAHRNNLPSIFSDVDIKKRYYSLVYGDSFPNFTYRSDVERSNLYENDLQNYYMPGEDFTVRTDGGKNKIATLISVDLEKSMAKVKMRYEHDIQIVHVNNIKRII